MMSFEMFLFRFESMLFETLISRNKEKQIISEYDSPILPLFKEKAFWMSSLDSMTKSCLSRTLPNA